MNQDFSSFVERYQLIYEKDPTSKVFAPLAEAYRRMGLLDEAIDLAERGVKRHPNFASGRVALGKCFAQRGEYLKAVEQLQVAVDLSPENLLGHQLIADCYQKLKKLPEALNAYKMVLFLNPDDVKSAAKVKEIEVQVYAQSQDFSIQDDFSMEKLSEVAKVTNAAPLKKMNQTPNTDLLERELALLDARMNRGDWETARDQIEGLIKKYPRNEDLLNRRAQMDERTHTTFDIGEMLKPISPDSQRSKILKLQKLMEKVESRRKPLI
jgi:tetratricopeptide (TPR) repeat protein